MLGDVCHCRVALFDRHWKGGLGRQLELDK